MMRRRIAIAFAAALIGAASLASAPAPAAERSVAPVASPSLLRPAQFHGSGPCSGDDGRDRRREWQEWRKGRDEARIAGAARREAWRRAMREQHGHGRGPDPA